MANNLRFEVTGTNLTAAKGLVIGRIKLDNATATEVLPESNGNSAIIVAELNADASTTARNVKITDIMMTDFNMSSLAVAVVNAIESYSVKTQTNITANVYTPGNGAHQVSTENAEYKITFSNVSPTNKLFRLNGNL